MEKLDQLERWCESKGWETDVDAKEDLRCEITNQEGEEVGIVSIQKHSPMREYGESAVEEAREMGLDPDATTYSISVSVENEGVKVSNSTGPIPASDIDIDTEDMHLGELPLEGVPLEVESHSDTFSTRTFVKSGAEDEIRHIRRDSMEDAQMRRGI